MIKFEKYAIDDKERASAIDVDFCKNQLSGMFYAT